MPGAGFLNSNLLSKTELSNRYALTPTILEDDKNVVYDVFVKPDIGESGADIYHTVDVSQEGRLDILAQLYYEDPSLWWMIAIANEIIDPFVVVAGSTVRIPSVSTYYLNAL